MKKTSNKTSRKANMMKNSAFVMFERKAKVKRDKKTLKEEAKNNE